LWSKDSGDTALAQEYIVPVHGSVDPHVLEAGIEVGGIDPGETSQLATTGTQFTSRCVNEVHAESLDHSRARVVDPTVAATDEDALDVTVQRSRNEFSNASTRGPCRIAAIARYERRSSERPVPSLR
jgi:hypothetical protein